jgi:hypothetical protein
MNSALILRLATGENRPIKSAASVMLLEESCLVRKLTAYYVQHPLFAVFRMSANAL